MARDLTPRRLIATGITAATLVGATLAGTPAPAAADSRPRGHDISSYQKHIDWPAVRAKGGRFVYIKATESDTYRNPRFRGQYDGSRRAGLLHGAYHFALPDASSGARQARYFLRHGGQWKADGWTLPPALDIEHNPYNSKKPCYGLSRGAMVRWIGAFSDAVRRGTGRRPVIYTTTRWWNRCTGRSRAFAATHPLWLAGWGSRSHPMPAGWSYPSIWQCGGHGPLPGDQDRWNGSMAQLKRFTAG